MTRLGTVGVARGFGGVGAAATDGQAVTLDRTAFYPGGGGQPNDVGALNWDNGSAPVGPLAAAVITTDAGDGIVAIDTLYLRPSSDASHLVISDGRAAFVDTGTNSSVPLLLDALHRSGWNQAKAARLLGISYKTLPDELSRGDTLLLDDGLIRPIVYRVLPFEEAAEAHRLLRPGGRLIVAPNLDESVAAAAHELGTPLATIKLVSAELIEELEDDDIPLSPSKC